MTSETKQRLILTLDDIKAAAAEKLPAHARGGTQYPPTNRHDISLTDP